MLPLIIVYSFFECHSVLLFFYELCLFLVGMNFNMPRMLLLHYNMDENPIKQPPWKGLLPPRVVLLLFAPLTHNSRSICHILHPDPIYVV